MENVTTNPSGGEGAGTIRLPRKSIQQEYLYSCLAVTKTFDYALSNLVRMDDPRPAILCRQVINRVLDDTIRYQLLDKLDEKMAEINNSKEPADIKAIHRISLAQDLVGEVNAYLDEFFALHKGQEIGDV